MIPSLAGLELCSLEPEHKLKKILASALEQGSVQGPLQGSVQDSVQRLAQKSKQESLASIEAAPKPSWNAAYFDLEPVSLFQESSRSQKAQILNILGQSLLAESYAIEKAGIGYMAKMTLLAETIEERMLYALFSADEATHLAQLMPYMESNSAEEDSFLRLLSDFLQAADRSALIFVIQVVLEGWGLHHYRSLSKHCQHPALADVFKGFLQAEAKHHGTGVTLLNDLALSSQTRMSIVEALAGFLQIVRIGPQRVVAAIAQVKGDLSRSQRIRLLTELETERHSGQRLELLRSLITPVSPEISEHLDKHNLFSPLPPERCT
ncbi:ferritin-like domain-containing protein [cf. Phormidesmis sp. LEGE 11477]|uniref:ferritin-like domain-containing protein n=1 Tax=cf. Phormidesmis sp. LEGE 11477 TaxID=1828680 RepID=UPI0018804DDF|nr:ferritin-like domain-containing protein [cf. Phormidesmis sp. LEGE 11477]MBE9063696.1 ferritin-like domain-containing protein [cf. Phormidesmis sp. LEGE 11477]